MNVSVSQNFQLYKLLFSRIFGPVSDTIIWYQIRSLKVINTSLSFRIRNPEFVCLLRKTKTSSDFWIFSSKFWERRGAKKFVTNDPEDWFYELLTYEKMRENEWKSQSSHFPDITKVDRSSKKPWPIEKNRIQRTRTEYKLSVTSNPLKKNGRRKQVVFWILPPVDFLLKRR